VRVVAALGGNALLERGENPDATIQQHHILRAVEALAPLCRDHDVVITHGNGPQVGLLALESDADRALSRAYPLDALGAQTQGMIGYWLAQALRNAVPTETFAALVCQTVVGIDDPGFANPSKFVGQVYEQAEAERLAKDRNWEIRQDGHTWRRVVPSPLPREIVELPVIERLLSSGFGVICCGGGGIPVVREAHGQLRGIEAVIDKDRTAALLAEQLGAEALLLLTDVAAVEADYGTPTARAIRETSSAELSQLKLPAGSMGPKVEAACSFVDATGHQAAIGRLEDAGELLAGTRGTVIRRSASQAGVTSRGQEGR
jgi:carbamate kinase